jgi:hypothetical protein
MLAFKSFYNLNLKDNIVNNLGTNTCFIHTNGEHGQLDLFKLLAEDHTRKERKLLK